MAKKFGKVKMILFILVRNAVYQTRFHFVVLFYDKSLLISEHSKSHLYANGMQWSLK